MTISTLEGHSHFLVRFIVNDKLFLYASVLEIICINNIIMAKIGHKVFVTSYCE